MVKRIALLTLLTLLLAACSPPDTSPTAQPLTEQEQTGQNLFYRDCAACHTISGDAVIVGPALAGVATRAETRVSGMSAHAYLEQSILDPSAHLVPGFDDLMPKSWGTTLTGEELDALVAFLLTLH
jgi:mono/diheme cytochrome c family protein